MILNKTFHSFSFSGVLNGGGFYYVRVVKEIFTKALNLDLRTTINYTSAVHARFIPNPTSWGLVRDWSR